MLTDTTEVSAKLEKHSLQLRDMMEQRDLGESIQCRPYVQPLTLFQSPC